MSCPCSVCRGWRKAFPQSKSPWQSSLICLFRGGKYLFWRGPR